MKYYKLFHENEIHHDMHYHDGMNIDIIPFNNSINCGAGGLYFSNELHILDFLGTEMKFIREISIPQYDSIIEIDQAKYKAHTLFLYEKHDLSKLDTWKWMLQNNINVNARDSYALQLFSGMGKIEIVKFLIEHGASVHARNNYAMQWANANNQIKTIEYLKLYGGKLY